MGATGSVFRRSKAGAATAKGKRHKTPKPQSKLFNTSRNAARVTSKKKSKEARHKPFGPGTQLGAHQNSPITIDSDDTDAAVNSEGRSSESARYNYMEHPVIYQALLTSVAHTFCQLFLRANFPPAPMLLPPTFSIFQVLGILYLVHILLPRLYYDVPNLRCHSRIVASLLSV
jgi:hypothetical protein